MNSLPPYSSQTRRSESPTLAASGRPGLPRRALGQTGLVVPILGFGVSGALATPLVSAGHTRKLVSEASAHGMEFFDTAPFYGNGRGERRLSAAVETLPRNLAVISTKAGTRRINRKLVKDFTLEGLTQQLEESLERLPHIDVFFLHGPGAEDLTPSLLDGLIKLRAKGYFRYLGVAARRKHVDAAVDTGAFDVLMTPAHLQLPAEELDRLERARARGLGVIGIECLGPATQGKRLSLKPADLWYTARAMFGAHRKITHVDSQATQRHTAAECLSWTLKSGLVDMALVTTSRLTNLRENIAIAQSC